MIKVIKPKPEKYTVKCWRCDAYISYEFSDLKYNMYDTHHLECPECNAKIEHKSRIVRNETNNGERVSIGDMIEIINMESEPTYTGRVGTITSIDDAGQLHGTWGGLALIPGIDVFRKIETFSKE